MSLALIDIYRLRADYLEWSGGKPPLFDGEIESFISDGDNYPGELAMADVRAELKRWMESGITELPFDTRICTYHGNAQMDAVSEGRVEEYGAPYVPVTIENADGLAIYCGGKGRKENNPGVVIERQSDRWVFFIFNDAFGDNEVIAYAMDDGRMAVIEDCCVRPDHLTIGGNIPETLPPEQWKYKEAKC